MRLHILACAFSLLLFSGPLAAQAPDDAKPSGYAPAAELVSQLKSYVESLTEATADPEDYDDDKQGEVSRDANTVAAIALVLGMHDEENEFKPAAAKLIAAAKRLSEEHEDAQKAAAAVKEIKAIVDKPEKGEKVEWKAYAEMAPLMKQVPIVNNNLRRGVTGRRFAQSTDKNAALAATLAAIAQASMLDVDFIAEESDRPLWIKLCAEMRDGAAEAGAAIRKKDQDGATKALDKIVKSCDDCHHKFRD